MVGGWLGGSRQGAGAGLMTTFSRTSVPESVHEAHTLFSFARFPRTQRKTGGGGGLDGRQTGGMKTPSTFMLIAAVAAALALLAVVFEHHQTGARLLIELTAIVAPKKS